MSMPVLPEPEGRFVTTALGTRYHLHDLGSGRSGGGADGADAAIFLHGGGPGCSAWTDFGQVSPLFATHRRSVLVDLLQYGRTDKVTVEGPMWDFHARHLLALLDALGVGRADFVCNSWGGSGAMAFAASHPERVRRLVVTGAMPVLTGALAPLPERGARGRNARDRYYQGEGPTLDKMRELIRTLEWYDPAAVPEETVRVRYEQSLDAEERAINDHPERRGVWQDLTARLVLIEAPTLFCWGMHDAFLTPDYPLMLASRLPRGNLYVMDRASHHLQEERPEEFHAAVAAFLDAPRAAAR